MADRPSRLRGLISALLHCGLPGAFGSNPSREAPRADLSPPPLRRGGLRSWRPPSAAPRADLSPPPLRPHEVWAGLDGGSLRGLISALLHCGIPVTVTGRRWLHPPRADLSPPPLRPGVFERRPGCHAPPRADLSPPPLRPADSGCGRHEPSPPRADLSPPPLRRPCAVAPLGRGRLRGLISALLHCGVVALDHLTVVWDLRGLISALLHCGNAGATRQKTVENLRGLISALLHCGGLVGAGGAGGAGAPRADLSPPPLRRGSGDPRGWDAGHSEG